MAGGSLPGVRAHEARPPFSADELEQFLTMVRGAVLTNQPVTMTPHMAGRLHNTILATNPEQMRRSVVKHQF